MPLDDAFENHIPAAVRRASQRADELARTSGVSNVPEEDTPEATEPPAEQIPDQAPAAEPATTTVVEQQPSESDNWEQRYSTLRGKYDSEIAQLRGHVSSLENLLANIKTPPPAAPPAAPVSGEVATIPQEDIEAFGEDLITAARRWAVTELSPRIRKLETDLEDLRSGQSSIKQETAQQRVMGALDADNEIGGKWREINTQPEFLTWLDQVDPFSGQQRMRLLSDAFARGDSGRTASFFKAFITEHTAIQPVPTLPAHTPDPGADRLSLESLAAPGRPAGSAPGGGGAPVEKRIWTRSDIAAFYRNVQRGTYEGRDAEKLRVEQDILDAAAEGRTRP